MKKKLMMVAVLLGALSLGACVDNDESASVTGVREAKAEQLKSIASLNQAQAQAELIAANAEAALKAAQAKVEEANAMKAQAEAAKIQKETELLKLQEEAMKLENEALTLRNEALKLENEAAKIENQKKQEELNAQLIENKKKQADLDAQLAQLEVQKKMAEQQLADIAAQMEYNKSQMEYQMMLLNKQIADLQAQMEAEKDKAESDKIKEQLAAVTKLSGEYARLLQDYNNAATTLATKKSSLLKAQNDLENWESLKAEEVATYDKQIASYDAQIAAFKKYVEYVEDLDALYDKRSSLFIDNNLAINKNNALLQEYQNLNINDARLKALELRNDIFDHDLLSLYNFDVAGIYFSDYFRYTPSYKTLEFVKDEMKYVSSGYRDSLVVEMTYNPYNRDMYTLKVNVDNAIKNQAVEAREKDVVDTKKAYDAAVKAVADAKAAHEKAVGTDKEAETWQAYQDALNALGGTGSSYWGASDIYESAKNGLENAKENVEKLKRGYELVTDTKIGDELQALVKTYDDAMVAVYTPKAEAYFAWQIAYADYEKINAEYQAVNSAISGSVSINRDIENYEGNKLTAENAKKDLLDTTNQEEYIASLELQIAQLDPQLAAKKINLDAKKAELDAAMDAVK